jgi:hypothetical protein
MTLKNAKLERAENLSPETRAKYELPERGTVIIETTNPDLKFKIKPFTGAREYLLSLGQFNDVEI